MRGQSLFVVRGISAFFVLREDLKELGAWRRLFLQLELSLGGLGLLSLADFV